MREVAPSLPPMQRQMLEDWRLSNCRRLIEVQAVRPGIGETVQDLLTGEVFEGRDISMSRTVQPGPILLARPCLSEGVLKFTGAGQIFTSRQKAVLLDFARQLWDDYRRDEPDATIVEFYREHGLDFYRFANEIAENAVRPKVLTPEGHEAIASVAEYRVRDANEVQRRLSEAEEFVYVGADEEGRNTHHYVWLLRGRSHVSEAEEKPLTGLFITTDPALGPGDAPYQPLGDVVLSRR